MMVGNGKQPMAMASSSNTAAIELDDIDDPNIKMFHESQRTGTRYQGDTWEELNVLTLDGGGIRGYWTLRVLESLMFHIEEAEKNYSSKQPPDPRDSRPDLRDRSIQEWEGTHSFWPERFPDHVSHTEKSERDQPLHILEEYKQWESEAHASTTSPEGIRRFHPARRFLPCHYFDYIAGTSTGALIAIMLGRFRMTVTDCLEEYRTLGDKVFGNPRFLHKTSWIPLIIGPNKFSAKTLEDVLKDFEYRRAEQRGPYGGPITFPTRPGLCKCLVVTFQNNPSRTSETTYLMRSYSHFEKPANDPRPLPFGEAQNFTTWEVARAATAAPTIFKKIKIWHQPISRDRKIRKKEYHEFSDGGFHGVNNPTEEAFKDIKELHGVKNGAKIGVMVSVGTAKAVNKRFGGSAVGVAKRGVDHATRVEKVAKDMIEKAQQHPTFTYFRLNESKNGCNVKLDEWKPAGLRKLLSKKSSGQDTLKAIDDCFEKWYPAHQQMLRACAEQLVKTRRERVLNKSRWERYATGAHYYCDEKNCEADFQYRQLFNIHLHGHYQKKGEPPPQIDDENENMEDDVDPDRNSTGAQKQSRQAHMDQCRTRWEYPQVLSAGRGRFR